MRGSTPRRRDVATPRQTTVGRAASTPLISGNAVRTAPFLGACEMWSDLLPVKRGTDAHHINDTVDGGRPSWHGASLVWPEAPHSGRGGG